MECLKALYVMKSSNNIDKTIKLRESIKRDEKEGDRSYHHWAEFQRPDVSAND